MGQGRQQRDATKCELVLCATFRDKHRALYPAPHCSPLPPPARTWGQVPEDEGLGGPRAHQGVDTHERQVHNQVFAVGQGGQDGQAGAGVDQGLGGVGVQVSAVQGINVLQPAVGVGRVEAAHKEEAWEREREREGEAWRAGSGPG